MKLTKYLLVIFSFFLLYALISNNTAYALVSNLVNFDSTSDLTNKFNSDGSIQFTNVSSGGISNTGAINVPLSTTDIWTTKQGYSVAGQGDIYTFSAFFKIQANGGYGGLGFSNADTNTGDSQGQPVKGIGMSFHGGGGSFVNNRTYTDVSWPPDLVLGNWYKMIFKVTAKGSNTYDLNFQIWNSDANGTLSTMKTEKILNGVVNSDLGSSSIIHGFFAAAGSRMEKIDNFLIELEGGAGFIEEGLPVVLTASPSAITGTTATSGGNVTDDQGAAVTDRGVCWNTSTSPTTANTCTHDSTGEGSYTSSLTGLSGSTTYYIRAYAINSQGTSYGGEYSFTTSVAPTPTLAPSPTLAPTSSQSSSSSSDSSGNSAPICNAAVPSGAPDLFQIDTSQTAATVYFAPISGISKYYISYASDASAEQHGVEVNLGSVGVQSYTMNLLSPNTIYYFKVRGQNSCMPGSWSTIKAANTSGQYNSSTIIQTSIADAILPEKKLEIVSSEISTKKSNVCSYTVQSGDSLWQIANTKLEDGSRFIDLKELNSLGNNMLSIGQVLKLPCDQSEEGIEKTKEEITQQGTKLDVLVKDSDGIPLEGVTVTLHSKVQVAKTNTAGIAKFENVEHGDHRVILAYNDYQGEQKLTVDGSKKEQTLTLQVEMTSGISSKIVISIISIMAGIIVLLLFIIVKRRQKSTHSEIKNS